MATVLGIDYGHKKIGFAVGNSVLGTAKPLEVVFQNGEMWRKIDKIFTDWQPKKVVIGKPELADGKPHPLEKSIESFIIELKMRYNAMICRENEAYTSFEAANLQCEKEIGKSLDALAASVILESWLRANS